METPTSPIENGLISAALAVAIIFVGIVLLEMMSTKLKATPEDMRNAVQQCLCCQVSV